MPLMAVNRKSSDWLVDADCFAMESYCSALGLFVVSVGALESAINTVARHQRHVNSCSSGTGKSGFTTRLRLWRVSVASPEVIQLGSKTFVPHAIPNGFALQGFRSPHLNIECF